MQTYLINLDRSPERLRFMAGRLAAHGIGYQRVAAVDGRSLEDHVVDAVVRRVPGAASPSKGEIACFLSHRLCWQTIVDSGEPHGCVLEDDVEVSLRLQDFLTRTDWLPHDADIVKIETMRETIWLDRKHKIVRHGFQLARLRSRHDGCAGYIVSSAAARRLLAITPRFSDPVDLVMFDPEAGAADSFVIYQISPALCIQTQLRHPRDSPDFMPSALRAERARSRLPGRKKMPKLKRTAVRFVAKIGHWLRNRTRTSVPFEKLAPGGSPKPPAG